MWLQKIEKKIGNEDVKKVETRVWSFVNFQVEFPI